MSGSFLAALAWPIVAVVRYVRRDGEEARWREALGLCVTCGTPAPEPERECPECWDLRQW